MSKAVLSSPPRTHGKRAYGCDRIMPASTRRIKFERDHDGSQVEVLHSLAYSVDSSAAWNTARLGLTRNEHKRLLRFLQDEVVPFLKKGLATTVEPEEKGEEENEGPCGRPPTHERERKKARVTLGTALVSVQPKATMPGPDFVLSTNAMDVDIAAQLVADDGMQLDE